MKKISLSLIPFLLLSWGIAAFVEYLTKESVDNWYVMLVKPAWFPPLWIFFPIWAVLYLFIALVGWLLYKAPRSKERTYALVFYGIQLCLNPLWFYLFFYRNEMGLGLIDLIFLWATIFLILLLSYYVSKPATYLFILYFLWVSFALVLNSAIYLLN